MPSRRSVKTPSAGVNGEITSSSATSPGAKSFLLGMIWTSSCSTLRFGGVLPPGTQTVNWLSLKRSLSSITVAVIVYCPPCLATNEHWSAAYRVDLTVQVCSSMTFSDHAPFLKRPVLENRLDLGVASRDQIAVNVGNDRLDVDLFALLDKCPRRLDTDIERRRMHEQRSRSSTRSGGSHPSRMTTPRSCMAAAA